MPDVPVQECFWFSVLLLSEKHPKQNIQIQKSRTLFQPISISCFHHFDCTSDCHFWHIEFIWCVDNGFPSGQSFLHFLQISFIIDFFWQNWNWYQTFFSKILKSMLFSILFMTLYVFSIPIFCRYLLTLFLQTVDIYKFH